MKQNKIFTIGYGGRKPDDFANLLARNIIDRIVDVRLRPDRASMGVYVKAKSDDKGIQALLSKVGISEYYFFVELGNIFLDFEDWRERYRLLLKNNGDLLFNRLYQISLPFCLLCAEKKAEDCHRKLIADYLNEKEGWEIEHIQ